MRERPVVLYLQDIADAGHAIRSYVSGLSFDDFIRDRMRQSAVIREFEVIGEAVGRLPDNLKALHPDIPWREIKDFRNLLIHGYFGVDLWIVWNTIEQELPALLAAVDERLKAIGEDPRQNMA
jgi:uncharacterized protein with HEPN domain